MNVERVKCARRLVFGMDATYERLADTNVKTVRELHATTVFASTTDTH